MVGQFIEVICCISSSEDKEAVTHGSRPIQREHNAYSCKERNLLTKEENQGIDPSLFG